MNRTVPTVLHYSVPVRAADPRAISLARRIAAAFTSTALRGAGTVRYGYPAIGDRAKYAGYVDPPQLFIGYSPARVAAGAFRGAPGSLPATSTVINPGNSPLMRSMATVSTVQMGGSKSG